VSNWQPSRSVWSGAVRPSACMSSGQQAAASRALVPPKLLIIDGSPGRKADRVCPCGWHIRSLISHVPVRGSGGCGSGWAATESGDVPGRLSLRALAVPADAYSLRRPIPAAETFRSLLYDATCLIVLDNALMPSMCRPVAADVIAVQPLSTQSGCGFVAIDDHGGCGVCDIQTFNRRTSVELDS